MAQKPNPPILKGEEKLVTPKGQIIYPWVFKKDEVKEKYACLLAVDPENPALPAFKEAVKAFGRKAFEPLGGFPKGLVWCVKGGEQWLAEKEKPPVGKLADLIARSVLIDARSVYIPTVSIIKGEKLVEVENDLDRKQIYTGMIGAMEGKLAAFSGKYPAVVFWFSQLAKLGQGEKLGGNFDPNKTFGGMYDPDDDTVGEGQGGAGKGGDLNDEIPF